VCKGFLSSPSEKSIISPRVRVRAHLVLFADTDSVHPGVPGAAHDVSEVIEGEWQGIEGVGHERGKKCHQSMTSGTIKDIAQDGPREQLKSTEGGPGHTDARTALNDGQSASSKGSDKLSRQADTPSAGGGVRGMRDAG
jgi:hypothetical protein